MRSIHPALRRVGVRIEPGLVTLLCLLIAGALMVVGYQVTARQVTVLVDGQTRVFRTHQRTVGGALTEAGVQLFPQDQVQPAWDAPLSRETTIRIQRAQTVFLVADGDRRLVRTHARSPAGLFQELNIELGPHDVVRVNGQIRDPFAPFIENAPAPHRLNSLKPALPQPPRVEIQRAIPFRITDDGVTTVIETTAATVGEALEAAQIPIYLGDMVSLPLQTAISPNLHLNIVRSKPVVITFDGRVLPTRTLAQTVEQLLAQEGIALHGKDYTIPGLDAPIQPNMVVQVVRVKQEYLIEEEAIPYETVWRPDPNLEIDRYKRVQAGVEGVRKRRIRIDYENGEEVGREVEAVWVDREPVTEVWHYGTKIVVRTLETPEGTLHYWRKLRVLVTSYSAATSGKSRDHPAYGITRLGWRAGKGVIAVDPRVINFYTRIYVPGYGIGTAVDTGGKIRGMHIDLGYDEDNLKLWYKWMDVYLLTPPPPENLIRWRLPNYPRERRRR